MSDLPQDVSVTAPSERVGSSAHLTFLMCSVIVAGFGTWASLSPIDIVSMATGEVIPSTQVKTIQHLEGGIVRKILVREGENIKKGEALIVLEPTASGADVGELLVRLNSLRVDEVRISGLIKGEKMPLFPSDLETAEPALVNQAAAQFRSQIARHKSEVLRQQQATIQRDQEINEITTRIKNQRRSLKLVGEQIGISEALLKDNLTNRFKHLDLLKEAEKLEGGIAADSAGLARARSALKEAKAELLNIKSVFDDENQRALNEARVSLGELMERVKKFKDNLARTTVRAPVDGVVKTLHVVTVGGVIRPGDPIAELVPAGDKLIIEAQLPTSDIGYVATGQHAVVKLASADGMRFGGLNGTVIGISPDTLTTPEGMPFYKVRIITDKGYFEKGDARYNLFPGMQMAVSIVTGDRTVMAYILGPIASSLSDANKER